jgi:hypothetical protein
MVVDFHPSQIPIVKTFSLKDEKGAAEAADEMTKIGFENQHGGFKVIMPKQPEKLARRIGFTTISEINFRLRKLKKERNLKYWTYHHDKENYAIVLISANVLSDLGL